MAILSCHRLALEACAASTIDNGGIVEMKSKDEIPREKEEEVDLTHYASTRNKAKEVLRVGDYVWFNATVRVQVLTNSSVN